MYTFLQDSVVEGIQVKGVQWALYITEGNAEAQKAIGDLCARCFTFLSEVMDMKDADAYDTVDKASENKTLAAKIRQGLAKQKRDTSATQSQPASSTSNTPSGSVLERLVQRTKLQSYFDVFTAEELQTACSRKNKLPNPVQAKLFKVQVPKHGQSKEIEDVYAFIHKPGRANRVLVVETELSVIHQHTLVSGEQYQGHAQDSFARRVESLEGLNHERFEAMATGSVQEFDEWLEEYTKPAAAPLAGSPAKSGQAAASPLVGTSAGASRIVGVAAPKRTEPDDELLEASPQPKRTALALRSQGSTSTLGAGAEPGHADAVAVDSQSGCTSTNI